jgi:hypothetical protein
MAAHDSSAAFRLASGVLAHQTHATEEVESFRSGEMTNMTALVSATASLPSIFTVRPDMRLLQFAHPQSQYPPRLPRGGAAVLRFAHRTA